MVTFDSDMVAEGSGFRAGAEPAGGFTEGLTGMLGRGTLGSEPGNGGRTPGMFGTLVYFATIDRI